ncbi:MAG: dihydrofolate reductase [Verrucomicrobiota bacterium]
MKVTMIAAVAANGVIGTGKGGLPWKLPRDIEHFRQYTAGRHLLVGRATYLEMVGWFQDRTPIVVSRTTTRLPDYPLVVASVEAGIDLARDRGETELIVSGGGTIYRLAMPLATRLVLTEVKQEAVGTVRFPEVDERQWREVESEDFPADGENESAMRMVTLGRR